jgi:hypothetical protein
MKKIIFFLSSLFILTSCSNTLEDYDGVYEGIYTYWEASTPNDITFTQSSQIFVIKTIQGYYFEDEYGAAPFGYMHWFSSNGKAVWDTNYYFSNGDMSEFHMEATIRGNELEYKNSEHYTYANGEEYTIHMEGLFDKQ